MSTAEAAEYGIHEGCWYFVAHISVCWNMIIDSVTFKWHWKWADLETLFFIGEWCEVSEWSIELEKREWRKLQKLVCARAYVLMTGSHIMSVNKWCIVSLSIAYCEYNYETLLRGGLQKCELCSRSRLVLSHVARSVVFMFVYPLHVTYWARLAVPWPTGRIWLTAFVVFFSKSIDWSGFSSVWSGMYDVDV